MNNETLNNVVAAAKAKAANSPAWMRCLDKAAAMLASGELCATVLADGVLVTSPNGSYLVTAGHCPCAARTPHCYHRCAARIATLLDAEASFVADVASTPRKQLIVEIKAAWPREWPPLEAELLRRFKCSDLNFLADDMLQGVRLAIAM